MQIYATDIDAAKALKEKFEALRRAIGTVIVGQEDVVNKLVISILCNGHSLLVGVPGLAKTLLVKTVADVLDLSFKRIQFTPDLMPSDITGAEILNEQRQFQFVKGPIFANIILADEINRTPPKTQSALLEAMQEFEVTYAGQTYPLDRPFFILATQNPIEQAGTYPLPEAQLDRFLLYIKIGYPTSKEEIQVLSSTTGSKKAVIEPVINGSEIEQLQKLVREVAISDDLIAYVSTLIRATRPDTSTSNYVKEWVRWGAGPRAGQSLIVTAKARALFKGRYAVIMDDLHAMAYPVLRHRILMNFKADAENITADNVTADLLKSIERPKGAIG